MAKHILIALIAILAVPAMGNDLSLQLAVEGTAFAEEGLYPEQGHGGPAMACQMEYYHAFENGSLFALAPFMRIDGVDAQRTHGDISELSYTWVADSWELLIGFDKVFWGVTEFLHLADIINQTDLVESIDGEEKLGQPMIHASWIQDWGLLELLVMTHFRERTFPGEDGRFRFPLVVDSDYAQYEEASGVNHTDIALRYSHTIGDWDAGLYHFVGTGRDPLYVPGLNRKGEPILYPYYYQIRQTGLDLQRLAGEWLLKAEAIYRRSREAENFLALVAGAEYTFAAIGNSNTDLTVIAEWAYDDRGDDAPTAFENDLMLGMRIAFNDTAGSEILAGIVQDLDTSARSFSLEASRRVGENWKAAAEIRAFGHIADTDPLYFFRNDNYIKVELTYYF